MNGLYSFNDQMRAMFGGKVYRLSLSAGCTCPNRDGTLSKDGCIFCSEGGSGDFASDYTEDINLQIEAAKRLIAGKIGRKENFAGYMAYFQSYTNTYGDAERLMRLFEEAAGHRDIIALSVATRPDCLEDAMIQKLAGLNEKKPVFVELGLQTVHEDTAKYINRCYELPVFETAVKKLKKAGIRVTVHVIIGLPGESRAKTRETVRYLADLKFDPLSVCGHSCHIDGIKLQLMHVIKGTKLAGLLPENAKTAGINRYGRPVFDFDEISGDILCGYGRGFTGSEHGIILKDGMILPQYTLQEYASFVKELVGILPDETAVHRLTGDAPKKLLILPQWSADKKRVLNTVAAEFGQ